MLIMLLNCIENICICMYHNEGIYACIFSCVWKEYNRKDLVMEIALFRTKFFNLCLTYVFFNL